MIWLNITLFQNVEHLQLILVILISYDLSLGAYKNLKSCTFIFLTLHFNSTSHFLNEHFTDAEAKSCALRINIGVLVQLHKVSENIF